MITAALSFLFLFCLVYGRLPLPALIVISTGIAIALLINSRHEHNEFISIDVVAQLSRLKRVNALLKIATLLLLMIICVASQTVWTGVFLCTVMLFLTVLIGGIKLHEYLQILALPVSFLLISGLVLLFEARPEPEGVISIAFFSQWLCISQAAQLFAGLVVARALGAISCLLTMGMSTTMPEIIGALRRLRCPELVIDLMYLIYRYLFVLLSTYQEMLNAAKSRLGMRDYRTSIRTTASLYSSLLARSYHMASVNFDAMESRCFESGIRFLEKNSRVSLCHAIAAAALVLTSVSISMPYWLGLVG